MAQTIPDITGDEETRRTFFSKKREFFLVS
jgi:hypothetical protein